MASDRLYDLAFLFRKLKLWNRIPETALYAIRFDDGEIGYCSVMGELGEHLCLCVYLGQSGYASYQFILNGAAVLSFYDQMELIAAQNSLQCAYESKDYLGDEELDELRDYCRRIGKNLRGKNACPHFLRFMPGKYPRPIESAEEESKIKLALEASIWLNGALDDTDISKMLQELWNSPTRIPALVKKDGKWMVEAEPLPAAERIWPAPVFENEVLAAKIRKLRKSGTWETGTFYLTEAVLDEEEDDREPYFPLMLLNVEQKNEMIVCSVPGSVDTPKLMLQELGEQMVDMKLCPKKILAADDRAYALLSDFCKKAGIRLEREDDLPLYEEAREMLYSQMEGMDDLAWDEEDMWDDEPDGEFGEDDAENLDQFLSTLMLMRDEELSTMPRELVQMIFRMGDMGYVPDSLIARLQKLFP